MKTCISRNGTDDQGLAEFYLISCIWTYYYIIGSRSKLRAQMHLNSFWNSTTWLLKVIQLFFLMARSCASQSGCILCHRSNDDPSLARRVRSPCTRWGCLASFTVLRSQGRPGNWNGQEIFLQGKKAICELTVTRSLYRPTNICAGKTDTAGTAQVPWLLRALEIRSSCLKGSSSWQSH